MNIRIRHDVYIHNGDAGATVTLSQVLASIGHAEKRIMGTLQDIIDSETADKATVATLAGAVKSMQDDNVNLRKQLADALSGTTLPAAVQTQVDLALADSKANHADVQAIIDSLATPASNTAGDPVDGGTATA